MSRFYRIAVRFCAVVLRFFFNVHAEGMDNIPKGGFLLVSNHISAWDPLMLAIMLPNVHMRYMAKESLFRFAPLRYVLNKIDTIRVNRGSSNMQAMRSAIAALNKGQCVGIFPEGHRFRTGKIGDIETGVAMLILSTKAEVVPSVVHSSYKPFARVNIIYDKPIDFSDLRGLPRDADTITMVKARLTARLSELYEVLKQEC